MSGYLFTKSRTFTTAPYTYANRPVKEELLVCLSGLPWGGAGKGNLIELRETDTKGMSFFGFKRYPRSWMEEDHSNSQVQQIKSPLNC